MRVLLRIDLKQLSSAYVTERDAVLEPVHVHGGRFVGEYAGKRERQLPLVDGKCADGRRAAHLPGPRHVLQRRRRARARRAGRDRARLIDCGPRGSLQVAIADPRVAHYVVATNILFDLINSTNILLSLVWGIYQSIDVDNYMIVMAHPL